jgi:hypothetical protein
VTGFADHREPTRPTASIFFPTTERLLIGFFRFSRSSRHSFAPQIIDFVDNFYPVVASKCSSRSNLVLLKSATSRQVAGRSSPFIAHIAQAAGLGLAGSRGQHRTGVSSACKTTGHVASRLAPAKASMQLRPGLPVARPREYAWQRIAEFGNDDVRHQALRFPRPAQTASLFSSS